MSAFKFALIVALVSLGSVLADPEETEVAESGDRRGYEIFKAYLSSNIMEKGVRCSLSCFDEATRKPFVIGSVLPGQSVAVEIDERKCAVLTITIEPQRLIASAYRNVYRRDIGLKGRRRRIEYICQGYKPGYAYRFDYLRKGEPTLHPLVNRRSR